MSSCNNYLVKLIVLLASCTFLTDARVFRLLNSKNAADNEFKYTVSLQFWGRHECGGALISERHVLTVAHCFVSREKPPYTEGLVILTGTRDLNFGGERHTAKSVTIHPKYVKGNSENRWRHDIAVITLATPATTNAHQAPISLPSRDINTSVTGVVSGWGALGSESDAVYPDILQKRTATILTQAECNSWNPILDTHLCSLDGKDTGFCYADSGGPLVYNNEIVGIVSFSISCGSGYPDVYTRVWSYKDFITKVMESS